MKLRPLVAGSRGLAAAAVAALALGIGVTALMFAIVDGTVRRGLPVPRAGDVVHLERLPAPGSDPRASFVADERARLAEAGALSAAAAYQVAHVNVAAAGVTPRRWAAALVTGNTFAMLGVEAARGRIFDAPLDAGGVLPVLISDDVWRVQLGAEPSAVGRAIEANDVPAVVTGVMPPGFRFPFNQHLWIPIDERAGSLPVAVWGRLAPGVGVAEAASRLSAAYAAPPPASARVGVAPFTAFIQGPQVVRLLDMMFLAGLGVLAIACANVANLLLARGLARRRDFAIAAALGASRARIMRGRIAEGLALAAPGALLGVVLAYAGASAFTRAIAASSPPYWVSVVIDARVLAYAAAIALLSALAASALPSWRSGSAAVSAALSDEARGATSGSLHRTTAALIIVEVALAASVLIAAGLMARGIAKLAGAGYVFAVEEVTTGRVSLPARTYPGAGERRAFFMALHARLQALPGAAAALGTSMPFAAAPSTAFALGPSPRAPDEQWPTAHRVAVSPGYFAALGVNPLGGRDFEIGDGPDRTAVAIVNLSFALKHARREDLIGRTIRIGSSGAPPAVIVGIVPDLAVGNARGERPEAVYVPLFQQPVPPDAITVLARGGAAAGGIERALRDAVSSIDPALPLDRVATLETFRESVTWFYRVFGFLFLAFGLGALVLALIGVYAVMSFGVTRRRREIGTRMAFGATRGDIARMFLLEGSWRLAAGLAGGALLAAWLTPRLSLFLFRVSPRDPAVFAAALAIVAAVGLAACALPAWRAARQDPNACLREP
ncbi:MAG TPA: FtsX-like permease family protein [Vicinamibacterales bacterium]|nr:FtsX-like permease family protein [Vicinamibacterales bacterium]